SQGTECMTDTDNPLNRPLADIAEGLSSGATTSVALVEAALDRMAAPDGEGSRTFLSVDEAGARSEAAAWDAARERGNPVPAMAGIPIAYKDLFDIAGEVTTAGSRVLADAAPASDDAPVVTRMRDAGFVTIGRTNMVEFAFGGLGPNPHYGTPRSVFDRDADGVGGRAPGGSSSGSAVAVADGMAGIALGTDTGGSCRIPAAFNGLVGYKPTAAFVSTEGVFPLAYSFDSVGPIGRTVACCGAVHGLLADDDPFVAAPMAVNGFRLGVLQNIVLDGLDDVVATAFGDVVSRLSAAGLNIVDVSVPAVDEIATSNASGIVPMEAWAVHRERLKTRGDAYCPRVAKRVCTGGGHDAADYIEALKMRWRIGEEARVATEEFDALIMPSVAIQPPRLDTLDDDETYFRTNGLALRNTSIGNYLDRCAISLPIRDRAGETLPVGLMLMGEHGDDAHLFAVAQTVEAVIDGQAV
ncbi:MAG: amidase, partial [Pseudomonadota bacterium]